MGGGGVGSLIELGCEGYLRWERKLQVRVLEGLEVGEIKESYATMLLFYAIILKKG